jgi:DNA-directed RNA polymerase subunit M/transcription elongation factor TFIIS
MSKLNTIYTTNLSQFIDVSESHVKLVMKMSNLIIPLFSFAGISESTDDGNCMTNEYNLQTCNHQFVFKKKIQMRAADEPFTSIYICKLCNLHRLQ